MAGVIMVFRDVTERRLAEREHAALLERERAAAGMPKLPHNNSRPPCKPAGWALGSTRWRREM